jgi:hypothetical protein
MGSYGTAYYSFCLYQRFVAVGGTEMQRTVPPLGLQLSNCVGIPFNKNQKLETADGGGGVKGKGDPMTCLRKHTVVAT